MSHEITITDAMVSIREKPWHGLGDILDNDISVFDARQRYLTWDAYKTPLYASVVDKDDNIRYLSVHNKFGVLREDTNTILGVSGKQYTIYQNNDMWDFIDLYIQKTKMSIESIGELKEGQYTWVLLKGKEFEIVKGDPICNYFLFRNSFTGATPVSTLFTNVRLISNSVLSISIPPNTHIRNVKHLSKVISQIGEVEKSVHFYNNYQNQIITVLNTLIKKSFSKEQITNILENIIFPLEYVTIPECTSISKQRELLEKQRVSSVKRGKKIQHILNLINTKHNKSIKVHNTGYSLLLALFEWFDHDMIVKTSIFSNNTYRFERAMFSSSTFKTNLTSQILKYR